MKMKLKWTDRIIQACSSDLVVRFFYNDPIESGNYWITDGNTTIMGFYNTVLGKWFIYDYSVLNAFNDLVEVNKFHILGYSKVTEPKVPKKYRNDSK